MIVLDCSAAVEIARKTSEGNSLRLLIEKDEPIISSELLFIEAASAFSKYVKSGSLDANAALRYLQATAVLVNRLIPIHENYVEAFHESLRLNHSVYDMLYLTLARRNGATLITLDDKLMKICEEQGVDCVNTFDI